LTVQKRTAIIESVQKRTVKLKKNFAELQKKGKEKKQNGK
jgi:hypothetical protein